MRLLLSRMLEQGGHVVTTAATDGQEAWEAYVASPAPLLILDWEMPRMDGLELCRRIRSSEHGDEAFILVITARDKTEDLTAVLDAGADDYMSKPVTPDNLNARLRIAERRIAVNARAAQRRGEFAQGAVSRGDRRDIARAAARNQQSARGAALEHVADRVGDAGRRRRRRSRW